MFQEEVKSVGHPVSQTRPTGLGSFSCVVVGVVVSAVDEESAPIILAFSI